MEWTTAWQSLAALGLGLVLGRLWPRLGPPPPRTNPWAQRSCRDWDQDKHGSALDGVSGRLRWLHDRDEAGR